MIKQKLLGLSLIELLVVIAILAILSVTAIYTYQDWYGYANSKRSLMQLTSAITVAENFALSSGRTVTLCKSQSGEKCDEASWSQGFIVFFDDTNRHQVTADKDVIKVLPAIGAVNELNFYGFPSGNYWQYQPKMATTQNNGTFVYCDQQHTNNDWRLVISKTGRYRVEQVKDERCVG